ncbi:MAG: MFS transporter, partial [Myxococcales bacterium]|nr:MFS transporter [Myxococcales bacterium]
SLQGTGFPIGATLGGAIAAPLIASHGWRSAFVLGGVASLLLVPVVLAALPESMDYLVSKRPRDALRRLNRLLERMQRPSIDALPQLPPKQAGTQSAAYLRLFSGDLRRSSVLIALTFFLVMFCFYFVLSWTPKLLVAAGMSATQGITGGVLLNLGGIGGGLALGYLAAFSDLRRLTIATFLAGGVSLVLFGAFCDSLGAAFGVAVALGITLFGAMIGLYALTPTLYSPDVRATGMGWAVGMGRFGAIASPATVGLLIDAGWQGSELYYMFALPLLLAVGTVASIARR